MFVMTTARINDTGVTVTYIYLHTYMTARRKFCYNVHKSVLCSVCGNADRKVPPLVGRVNKKNCTNPCNMTSGAPSGPFVWETTEESSGNGRIDG